MECDRCGADRPRSGPCPECGAPAPGTFSSMRQWKDQARTGKNPAVGRGDAGSSQWRPSSSGSGGRAGGSDWRTQRPAGGGWDEQPFDDDVPPSRSGGRNRGWQDEPYQEQDLERAVVPVHDNVMMDPAVAAMGGAMGFPATEEAERAFGIRRPVYIPATGERRKRKLGSWRVLSGVMSIMLVCIGGCGLLGVLGRGQIERVFGGPVGHQLTPIVFSTANVPVTPVATPGPQSKFVQNVVTSTAKDLSNLPTNPTSHFLVGSTVFVTMLVRSPAGQTHTISIRWFLQGTYLALPNDWHTSKQVDHDQQVFFSLSVPSAGLGMAKIYLDRPASDAGDAPNDPYLAATIYFAVEMPTPTATPAVQGSPTGGSKTPTPKASAGGAPVAWIQPSYS